MATLRLAVVSPERTLYEGEASQVVVPAFDGEVGILPGHAPLMTLLGTGPLRITGSNAPAIRVEGGFLQVVDNVVRVVTEKATVG
ncbi:MAG: ATP synthase F1 subunit epsilon [Gemmatimonadaceae bacterium]|nr:ATP synthase F1 subunit epsilon [Gemmatimonadaceae bacterium]